MRTKPSRSPRTYAAITLVALIAMIAGGQPAPGASAVAPASHLQRFDQSMALYFGQLRAQTGVEDELDGLDVRPIDLNMAPEEVLRQRPFVVGDETITLLTPDRLPRFDELTEETAPTSLASWLSLRGVGQESIDRALARLNDRKVKRMIPALNLRVALLMLTDWKPYDATIAAVLDGKNPSGEPYAGVIFESLGMDGAIATLYEDPETGLHTMVFDSAFEREPPEVLISTIVHEALHGGGKNSAEEEIFANMIDAICWAEVLAISPEIGLSGSDLTYYNNVKLIALLNSSGRSGPGAIGIATSAFGDVYVGEGLEGYDAESIRAETESAWFYDALRNVGSDGQQTTAAQLRRFPGGKALAKEPRYDERALAIVDAGVTKIVTPELAVRLASLLQLQITAGFTEEPAAGDGDAADLGQRPFVPADAKLFTYAPLKRTGKPLSEEKARAALERSLAARDVDPAVAADLLERFDDPTVIEQITDPSLRAATLLLGGVPRFASAVDAVLGGDNADRSPLQVIFVDMRDSAPAARRSDWNGEGIPPAILVNSLLQGESPQLLASVIVEALFLHDDVLTKEEAISAAAFGTLAWAEIIAMEPKSAVARTWGVMQRNLYLLAMLNSASSDGAIGIVGAPDGVADVLPSVYADATSFAEFVDQRPWGVRFDRSSSLEAPEVFVRFLSLAGVEPRAGMGGIVAYDERTLQDLDFAVEWYLTPTLISAATRALKLGAAER